jgi:DNA-binding NtrC family response regulator
VENPAEGNAVLIVDDEPSVLKALKRLLGEEAYEIYMAESHEGAMELMASHTFAVVITDFRMPGVSGDDILGFVKAKSPRTIRVMLSGSAYSCSVPDSIANGILNCQVFIAKPWNDDELRATIKKCIAEYEAGCNVNAPA